MAHKYFPLDFYDNKWQFKPLVYLLASLGIWVATIYIMSENKDGLLSKLEDIRPYKMKKLFDKWDDVMNDAKNKINQRWIPVTDDACFRLTTIAGADCIAKRQGIVTDLRTVFKCDINDYRSPFCSCIHKVLDPVTADNRAGTSTPSLPTSTFVTAAKDVIAKGGRDEFTKSVESCHFLHHTTTVADQPDAPWGKRSIILFVLSTVVTLALLDFFVLIAFSPWIRLPVILLFLAIILFAPSVIISNNGSSYATNVGLFVLLPTLVIFVWVELFLYDQDKKHFPFLHPGYFPIIHAMLIIYALTQNGVLDEDLIRTEIFKSHTLSYLYLCLCFYSSVDGVSELKDTESIQDSTFFTVLTILLTAGSTAVAPFAESGEFNVLWALPTAFVMATVVGVLWMDTKDRLGGKPDEKYTKEPINLGTLYQSTILITIVAVAAWYGMSEYWKVERLFLERFFTTSIQYNITSQAWQNPRFVALTY